MRVSDYVIEYLRDNYQVDTIFTVSGGGCIWLIDSLGKTEGVKYICNHHEQASAIAAEGYSRMSGKLGVCIVTSGPGGTNALTGVLGAYLDSIPILVISGNVNKNLTYHDTRQLGDQEFDIVSTVKTMTKYSVKVDNENDIKWCLDKACKTAMSDRPGPVWIDIPLDVQSKDIDPTKLSSWNDLREVYFPSTQFDVKDIITKLKNATKPLLIIGNGIRLSGKTAIDELEIFIFENKIPVISAVNGNDIINDDNQYYCGRFGTHAQIAANKIISEADLVLSIGSRLYVRQIGYNFKGFAKNAYKIYVDIDPKELSKSTLFPDLTICSDAGKFLKELNDGLNKACISLDDGLEMEHYSDRITWMSYCKDLYKNTPTVLDRHRNNTEYVSNYYLIERLNQYLKEDTHVVTSDGGANVVTMQVIKLKGKQRLFTNTGCAAMGYGLPAAIGAASTGNDILLIDGDGSFHLNIHELQTIVHYNLPIKILLLNNNGYNSIKITQKTMMKGHLVASTPDSGVSFPNFKKIANAYNISYYSITQNRNVDYWLNYLMQIDGPFICEVFTDPEEYHEPKVIAKVNNDGTITPGNLEDIKWIE